MVQEFLHGDITAVVVSLIKKNKRQNGGQEGKKIQSIGIDTLSRGVLGCP